MSEQRMWKVSGNVPITSKHADPSDPTKPYIYMHHQTFGAVAATIDAAIAAVRGLVPGIVVLSVSHIGIIAVTEQANP